MSPRAPRQILIPVTIGEDYQTGLLRRLTEYGILRKEVAAEMGVHETQFSRWMSQTSPDTGRPISIGLDNVIKIERAILAIRARREHAKAKKGRGKDSSSEE